MGREAEVRAEFCSDPGPIRVTWNWEQIALPAGNEYGGELHSLSVDTISFVRESTFLILVTKDEGKLIFRRKIWCIDEQYQR